MAYETPWYYLLLVCDGYPSYANLRAWFESLGLSIAAS